VARRGVAVVSRGGAWRGGNPLAEELVDLLLGREERQIPDVQRG
jgi:hypothetical protein